MVFCAAFCLLSTGLIQPIQTANAESLLHDEAKHDNYRHNTTGDIISYPITESDRDLSNLTREETLRRACVPGFFTPEQTAIQDKEDNGDGQRGTNPLPIKALILIDEEAEDYYYGMYDYLTENYPWYFYFNPYYNCDFSWCSYWAENILEGGHSYMESQYGINFIAWHFMPWASNNTANYYDLLYEMNNSINPASYGCDIVVLMSGQDGYDPNGTRIAGAAFRYTPPNGPPYFVMNINASYGEEWEYGVHQGWHGRPLDHLFAHEASHLFGCRDHPNGHNAPSTPCCVMCYDCCSLTLQYCPDCDFAIHNNSFRFDDAIVGYVTDITLVYESGGGAKITNENNIKGMYSDNKYATLYSGTSGNRAVLNVQMTSASYIMGGTLYLRAYSGSSMGNHLIIYKSLDGVNWSATPILNTNLYSPNTPIDVNCGHVSAFKYLSIVVINDYGYIGTVYIDSIHVHD